MIKYIKKKWHQWFICKHNWKPIGEKKYVLNDTDDFIFVFQKHRCAKCNLKRTRHMNSEEWYKHISSKR